MSACVYRIYGEADDLLYIGKSVDPATRVAWHRSHQPWADEIHRYEVVELPAEDLAFRHERESIARENPRHNVIRPGFRAGVPRSCYGGKATIGFTVDPAIKERARQVAEADYRRLGEFARVALVIAMEAAETFGESWASEMRSRIAVTDFRPVSEEAA